MSLTPDTAGAASAAEAETLLRRSASATTTLRASGQNRHALWLGGMAVASSMYLAGLGATSTDAQVLLLTAPFVIWVAVLCVALLPGAMFRKEGMTARLVRSLVAWGAVFGVTLALGLAVFRGEPWFFLLSGVLVAVPLAWGAWTEMRA